MDKPDLLMKAKALAALEHGVIPNGGSTGMAFHAVRFVNRGEHLLPCERPLTEAYDTPIEALAAAADAFGLEPDPDVVVLTEEEKAILNDALVEYYNVAIREAENLQRRGYEEYARRWIDSAQKTDSLRQRLAK